MSNPEFPKLETLSDRIADENCFVEQVVNSIFDYVANENLLDRADADEIVRFSSSILENEVIFGSPDDAVLNSVHNRITEKLKKKAASRPTA